jgi:GNAT superfamily N-acetyltransferase
VSVKEGIRIELITPSRYDDVFHHMKNNYILDVPTYKAYGVECTVELLAVYRKTLDDGVSMMAVDSETGNITGVHMCTIDRSDGGKSGIVASIQSKGLQTVWTLALQRDHAVRVFETYDVTEVYSDARLSVDRRFRRSGIGKMLIEVTLAFGREMGFKLFKI